MGLQGKLRTLEGGQLGFWCPGCEEMHGVTSGWKFNGNYDSPTFSPSVLVTNGHYTPGFGPSDTCWCTYNRDHPDSPAPFACSRCHFYIIDGKIRFLEDCTHALAGKILDLTVPE